MATVVNRQTMSDAELIGASRAGDVDAFAELYRRHQPAARSAARALCRNRSDADDLVSEAFVSVLRILQNGNGPDLAFRPYLLVALRNRFYDRARRPSEDPMDEPTEELDLTLIDRAASGEDRMLAAAAFATLPERWQMVLWHTEVEGRHPAEIAPLLGLAPNAVAALAYRAREGLRQAYLQAHLQTPREAGCAACVPNLAAYVRDSLSGRDRQAIDAHLAECESCRGLLAELADTNEMLRAGLVPAIMGASAVTFLSRLGRKGVAAWFGRLSRLQQAGAASSAAAAAVVAGVMTAAVFTPGATDPTIAAGPTRARSAATTTVVESDAVRSSVTVTGTTIQLGTLPALPTDVSTTLPLGVTDRVPIRQVPRQVTTTVATTIAPPTTTTVPDTAAATTAPTTVPVVASLTLSSVQIGVALLGGQVRIGLTVSAAALPISLGTRAFANLGVAMPLPAGVQLVSADNPAWSCTAQGSCTIASLASGATTSSVLTLDIADSVAAPISFAPAVTNPPSAVVQMQPLTIAPQTVPGLQVQEFARGSVTAIGNTVLNCPLLVCQYVPTSSADLATTGTVAKAVLVWSGVSGSSNRDQIQLTLPSNDVVDVTADALVDSYATGYLGAYLAYADVTAQVTAGGTYEVANLQTNALLAPLGGYGGWSLLVITHDNAQPQRSLMITVPGMFVDDATPFSLVPGGSISGTSDAHVIVSAFQASSSLLGNALHLNGFELTNPFHGAIASVPRNPELSDNFGVDLLDVTGVDVGAGSGTIDFASTNPLLLGAVAVSVDLS